MYEKGTKNSIHRSDVDRGSDRRVKEVDPTNPTEPTQPEGEVTVDPTEGEEEQQTIEEE